MNIDFAMKCTIHLICEQTADFSLIVFFKELVISLWSMIKDNDLVIHAYLSFLHKRIY